MRCERFNAGMFCIPNFNVEFFFQNSCSSWEYAKIYCYFLFTLIFYVLWHGDECMSMWTISPGK